MVDYKQVLRLRDEGVSQRGIAAVLGCSRNTVAKIFFAANRDNLNFAEIKDLSTDKVQKLLAPKKAERTTLRVPPDFEYVHRELARPAVTLLLLWNEYAAKCRDAGEVPYQYSFFNEQYRKWVRSTGASMRMRRSPGESIEVDWAGDPMFFTDPLNGEPTRAWLFVAALSYSAYTYVEAFMDMKLEAWIQAHVHAFEYFGGAARLLIPDNLRTGISKADRYEPVLNPTFARLAEYYNTAIIPARVRKPRDKPVVEGSVRFVAGTISATLRNRHFIGLAELNEAIWEETERINDKAFQKREDSRSIVFYRDEQPLLKSLPQVPFEIAQLRKAKVSPNYHVQVEKNFYSVPHTLIGESLDVRITASLVEVFDTRGKVASHTRLKGVNGRYTTVPTHMPPAHRAHLMDWSPERFTQWAQTIGPNTVNVIEAILSSRKIVEQSYRSCLGVMSLAKKSGGITRLEDACARALAVTPKPSYTLVKKLWARWEPHAQPAASLGEAGFVRGANYYAGKGVRP